MANTTTIRVSIGYGQSIEIDASMETLNALKKAKIIDTRWIGDNRYDYAVEDQSLRVELADPVKWTQTQIALLVKKHQESVDREHAAQVAADIAREEAA